MFPVERKRHSVSSWEITDTSTRSTDSISCSPPFCKSHHSYASPVTLRSTQYFNHSRLCRPLKKKHAGLIYLGSNMGGNCVGSKSADLAHPPLETGPGKRLKKQQQVFSIWHSITLWIISSSTGQITDQITRFIWLDFWTLTEKYNGTFTQSNTSKPVTHTPEIGRFKSSKMSPVTPARSSAAFSARLCFFIQHLCHRVE